MWYGKYLVYQKGSARKGGLQRAPLRNLPQGRTLPKWKAEQMFKEIILKETKGVGPTPTLASG